MAQLAGWAAWLAMHADVTSQVASASQCGQVTSVEVASATRRNLVTSVEVVSAIQRAQVEQIEAVRVIRPFFWPCVHCCNPKSGRLRTKRRVSRTLRACAGD